VHEGLHSYKTYTARELESESNRLARGLRRVGIGDGVRTVLMVTPSLEFFALTFALFKAGAVPVLVDPGMGVKNLKACLAEAAPGAFVGITKAHAARAMLGWARATNRVNVTVGPRLFWGGHTLRDLLDADDSPILAQRTEHDVAAILFTSGSTGIPKGAVYTHGNFDAQVRCLRDDYGIQPGERDLATFPLFALFGPALGMASVVPCMDASKPITADPRNLIAAALDYETTNLFASPALLDKLGRYAEGTPINLPCVRRVISAGAPAEPASLARFAKLLADGVPVIPSYGATEALPVARIAHRELIDETAALTAQGHGVCIGRPVSGMTVRVVRISDEAIAEWTPDLEVPADGIGEIAVKGPQVTEAYFHREDGTRLAKIHDPADGGVWHRMGDVGYFDAQGRLWFCGRKSHRVRTAGGDLFTEPLERIFNTQPGVRRTALVGVGPAGNQAPVICVELEPGTSRARWPEIERGLRAIGAAHERTRSVQRFLLHPKFPVDVRHNAKIFGKNWPCGPRSACSEDSGDRRRRIPGIGHCAAADRARRHGARARARRLSELAQLGVEPVRGDIADYRAVESAAAGCDAVIHAAAKAGVWGPYLEYYDTNFIGTQNVVNACRRHEISRLVYTSTPSVAFAGADQDGANESAPYPGKFLAHYPKTKAMAERLVLSANGPKLAAVALRPHLLWGPNDTQLVPRILDRARAGKLRIVGSGQQQIDATYIDNAALAHVLALDRVAPGAACAGKAYYISNGEPMAIRDVINRILDAAGMPPVTRHVAPGAAYAAGWAMEWAYRLLRRTDEPPMTRFVARQLATAHWYDISAARNDLGYAPAVTMDDGFERLRESLR
jgi:olefin beta-lactone synthetase